MDVLAGLALLLGVFASVPLIIRTYAWWICGLPPRWWMWIKGRLLKN
jgi:hypothetical protein